MVPLDRFPILEALKKHNDITKISFHVPAHRVMMPMYAGDGEFQNKYDLTELPGLDNLMAPGGIIEEAQELAARFLGSHETHFLVNGSSTGVMAAILATCRPGDLIVMGRNMHRSAVAGLVMSGAIPVFVPEESGVSGISINISTDMVAEKLAEVNDNKKAKAIFVTSPSYYGITTDLQALRSLADKFDIPLIVDEAHGGHFIFHQGFPLSASKGGADVWVNSAHKTMGALTPGAFVNCRGNRVDGVRLKEALVMLQTSSPPYPVLASLDLVRANTVGWDEAIEIAYKIRSRMQETGYKVLNEDMLPDSRGMDPLRISVFTDCLQISGVETGAILRSRFGIEVEMTGPGFFVLLIHPGHSSIDVDKLIEALIFIKEEYGAGGQKKSDEPKSLSQGREQYPIPPMDMTPRQAVEADWREVPLKETEGLTSAVTVAPFPPGTPVLIPGEIILGETIGKITAGIQSGISFVGLNNLSKPALQIVAK